MSNGHYSPAAFIILPAVPLRPDLFRVAVLVGPRVPGSRIGVHTLQVLLVDDIDTPYGNHGFRLMPTAVFLANPERSATTSRTVKAGRAKIGIMHQGVLHADGGPADVQIVMEWPLWENGTSPKLRARP
jgi:hypothetical protein